MKTQNEHKSKLALNIFESVLLNFTANISCHWLLVLVNIHKISR